MNNKKIKTFSRYTMSYEENQITNLLDSNGKETLFSYTFYMNNKDVLDDFENIALWVKPKRETTIKNNLVINLDDFSVSYSSNNDKVSKEDLELALRVIRNELSEANPEIAKKKALLIKYNNDIKTLKELAIEGMSFNEEIEEINEKIDELKKEINELLSVE